MSKKSDYSAEEWKVIATAPIVAGLFITVSDASGPVGIAKEAMAVGKAITDSASGDAPEIVKALAESVRTAGGRPELPDIPTGGDRAQTRNTMLSALKTAVAAVEKKSTTEAEAFKSWLASVATKVAHASKEGGFLGFGGTPVSAEEQAALNQLSEALRVGGPQVAGKPPETGPSRQL